MSKKTPDDCFTILAKWIAKAVEWWKEADKPTVLRCVICREEATTFVREPAYPISVKYGYHEKCVMDVINNPEVHSNRKVDMAIVVADVLVKRKNRAKTKEKKIRKLSTALREE